MKAATRALLLLSILATPVRRKHRNRFQQWGNDHGGESTRDVLWKGIVMRNADDAGDFYRAIEIASLYRYQDP
jgi:hypothetical protein